MGDSGWSVTGTAIGAEGDVDIAPGTGEDLTELFGVDAFEASPMENLARSLSSSVVLLPDGLTLALPSDAADTLRWGCAVPGLAGRWLMSDFRRFVSAASASWEEDESDARMVCPSSEVCAWASGSAEPS